MLMDVFTAPLLPAAPLLSQVPPDSIQSINSMPPYDQHSFEVRPLPRFALKAPYSAPFIPYRNYALPTCVPAGHSHPLKLSLKMLSYGSPCNLAFTDTHPLYPVHHPPAALSNVLSTCCINTTCFGVPLRREIFSFTHWSCQGGRQQVAARHHVLVERSLTYVLVLTLDTGMIVLQGIPTRHSANR